ncbi:MAG: DUF3419 family protein [Candidatus Saccharibacteria bacterium]|nr:DUF3419 family protein [Pseudorhodobacter sp.]
MDMQALAIKPEEDIMPPAQFEKLAAEGDGGVLPVLKDRVRKLVCGFPVSNNYFAWQAFPRRYQPGTTTSLPPYLQPKSFEVVARHANRVTVYNRSLTDLLKERGDATPDIFVLLDAQDWLTDAQLNALWRQIIRCARPGARVIFRTCAAGDLLPGRVARVCWRAGATMPRPVGHLWGVPSLPTCRN